MKKQIGHLKSKHFRRIQDEVENRILEERDLYLREQLLKYTNMIPQYDDEIVEEAMVVVSFSEKVHQ